MNKITLLYVGNILLKIDTCHSKYILAIGDDGKVIDTTGITPPGLFGGMLFGCSLGVNKGMIDFRIKVDDREVIGILSNIDECKNDKWITYTDGYRYAWYRNINAIASGFNSVNDMVHKLPAYQQFKKGDIVRIELIVNHGMLHFIVMMSLFIIHLFNQT